MPMLRHPAATAAAGVAALLATSLHAGPASADWNRVAGPRSVGAFIPIVDAAADGSMYAAPSALGGAGGAAPFAWFDPTSAKWTSVASTTTQTSCETVIPLNDGRWLCAYGATGAGVGTTRATTSSIYDPKSGTTIATSAMSSDRANPFAVTLGDGRVLFAGGGKVTTTGVTGQLSTAELYDPKADAWSAAPSLPGSLMRPGGIARLADGRVLITGLDSTGKSVAYMLDATASTWSPSTTPASAGGGSTRTMIGLADGSAVAMTFGGLDAFDAASATWKNVAKTASGAPYAIAPVGAHGVLVAVAGPVPSGGGRAPIGFQLVDVSTKLSRALPNAVVTASFTQWLLVGGGSTVAAIGTEQPGLPGGSGTGLETDFLTLAAEGKTCTSGDGCYSGTCRGGVCASGCTGDTDCASGSFCDGSKCVADASIGGSCARDAQCGSGHCLDAHCCADTRGCAPYVCAATGCTTSCVDKTGCAAGNVCQAGKCVPDASAATCSADLSQSLPKSAPPKACVPYVCDTGTGACLDNCSKSSDCQAGYACDSSSNHCLPSGNGNRSGGCAIDSAPDGTTTPWLAASGVALCLLGLSRSRRRARR